MDSLNVPVPAVVRREIEALRPALSGFDSVREQPTLVAKRFSGSVPTAAIESEVRLVLTDVTPFEVRLDGVGSFEQPVSGPGPVAYLAVESPGLVELHGQLVETFGAVEGVEGDQYVPHITLARGGEAGELARLETVSVDRVSWTVTELWFWDAREEARTGRAALTA